MFNALVFVVYCLVVTATAAMCLHNLSKTFKIGGRKDPPSQMEVEAVAVS